MPLALSDARARNAKPRPKPYKMSDGEGLFLVVKLSVDQQTLTDHSLGKKLDAMPIHVNETTRIPIGIYRGLKFGIVLHPEFPTSVFLQGSIARQSQLSRDHQGPRAVLNALERLADGYKSGEQQGPSISELADRIKALKAANTIEAIPHRVRQKQSTAEEPVTARIRKQTESPAQGPSRYSTLSANPASATRGLSVSAETSSRTEL